MKKLKLNLILQLLKKDFLFHKDKKQFYILEYDFVIKTIKQFLRLNLLVGLPIYIVSKEKKQNIILKKYLINFLKIYDIRIVEYPILTKESICIILNTNIKNFQSNNLYFKFDTSNEQIGFNFYKIFVDLNSVKKLLFIVVLLRRVYEKI
jgi:hypothetical protein